MIQKSECFKASPEEVQNPLIHLAGFVQIVCHNEGVLEANYKCLWFIARCHVNRNVKYTPGLGTLNT